MKPVQKIIKYLAIAFAIFLVINIFSFILLGLHIFGDVLGLTKKEEIVEKSFVTDFENINIATLNISLDYSNLIIKNGNTLKTEINSNDITCNQNNNQLTVEQEKHNWFTRKSKSEVIIYIPTNMTFDKVFINSGAGKIEIESLNAKELFLEIGAGNVEIQNLSILDTAKIEGGAGAVSVLDGEINNLDLDIGVGKFEIKTKLLGENKINAGIGELDVSLKDKLENYTIEADKGLGNININGKNFPDDSKYGNGNTFVKIEGGIGSINIK